MINRPQYLKKLMSFKDKQLIKIITGIRRSGKSTLFELYQAELLELGVEQNQIISINLENPDYRHLLNWESLYDYIDSRLLKNKKNYVFIDEVQNVPDFQRAADGLFIKNNVDLYLTGPNSKMQSGEWATLLSGRYVEIHMLPLSFKEYKSARNNNLTTEQIFDEYVKFSAFPYALNFYNGTNWDEKSVREYLCGIYNTIVLKDIVENKRIKEIGRLERVVKFMFDNIGRETSVKKISDMLATDGAKIMPLTVDNYLDAFRDGYILYKADRYDVKGKKLLKTLNKYYLADVGLRRFILGDKSPDNGRVLENIVYLELLRRGYKVFVGKVGDKEVDFVAEGMGGTEYYQVSLTILDPKTLDREFNSLDVINDHNPKYILTMDRFFQEEHKGIKVVNVLDWLLAE